MDEQIKINDEESLNYSPSFTVSFASLTLILLTFFAYLNAQAEENPARETAVLKSLAEQFEVEKVEEKPAPSSFSVEWLSARRHAFSSGGLFLQGSDELASSALPELFDWAERIEDKGWFGQLRVLHDRQEELAIARASSLLRFFLDAGVKPNSFTTFAVESPADTAEDIQLLLSPSATSMSFEEEEK